jgi:hypothetical protein
VVASAAESEVGACCQKSQIGAPLRVTLIEKEHNQPATHLRTYNSTAQVRTTLEITIPNIIQHNITKICALSYYIRLTA